MRCVTLTVLLFLSSAAPAAAQSSSMYRKAVQRQRANGQLPADVPYPDEHTAVNPELEAASLIAVKTPPPNRFEINDIITVIVREQKNYQSNAQTKSEQDWEIKAEVDEFFKFVGGHLGAATFSEGRPNIDFSWETQFDGKGDAQRQDRLTFRIAVRVIDIKPNGQLVLSGKKRIELDEDVQIMNITGVCRAADITPDNSVLSSQVYDQSISVKHEGPLRDANRRGWLVKLLDWGRPF